MVNRNSFAKLKKILSLMLFVFLYHVNPTFSQVVITHNPLGYENLYPEREMDIPFNNCEREPRDPVENENVFITFKTSPIFNKQECFVDVILNEQLAKSLRAEFLNNYSGESYWKVNIGKFSKGDSVRYNMSINYDDNKSTKSNNYSFVTYGWDYITNVKSAKFTNNSLILSCESTNPKFDPEVRIAFKSETTVKFDYTFSGKGLHEFVKTGKCSFKEFDGKGVLSNSKINLEINFQPFAINLLTRKDGKEIVKQFSYTGHSSIGFLNDNVIISKVSETFFTPNDEKFFGFGERYNAVNQRGNSIDNYVVNICTRQELKTYIPIPFYFTNKNYGFFLNTTFYIRFDLDVDRTNKCGILSDFGRRLDGKFEYYLMANDDANKLVSDYTSITGRPEKIPVWSLGPWISANEWDKQIEIEEQLDSLKKYDIPNTVVILEAWSDEETFYIFNDAIYKTKPGSEGFSLKDFQFSGRWPDPIGMIADLHKNNMRLILWNIPVLKASRVFNAQRESDEKYAIEKKYIVRNSDGTPFRMPNNSPWFGKSLNLDFTNKDASEWWMNKRKYLVEEMKIDGFRCDGGEFIWGRDLMFSNGRKGDEMRNLYPNLYVEAYYKVIKSVNKDAIVFHRAGTFGAQGHPLAWNGDQNSSFPSFKEAIRSCMNLSLSGIPFVAYDIAGYVEEQDLNTELYKRSVAQATFSPVMQFHSGYPADSHLERTPWDIARRYNDPSCINVYKKFVNVRFNIIPYLFTEGEYVTETGFPLMRPLVTEYPLDADAAKYETDYKLGRNLLVYPVTEPGNKKGIYLPEGEWFDLWSFKKYSGKAIYNFDVPDDHLPVFIKSGSITPLNMNKNFQLASGMTNELNSYNNLTFIVFSEKAIEYDYSDYVEGKVKKIKASSENGKMILEIPPFKTSVSFIVNIPSVKEVLSSGKIIDASVNWEEFLKSNGKYFYSIESNMLYVKLNAAKEKRTIVIKMN